MKILRLLITKTCHRDCDGCCNKDWDLDKLPIVEHFDYDQILITGGEPLLNYKRTIGLIETIKVVSNAKIYVYTNLIIQNKTFKPLYKVLQYVDGVTITLHDRKDSDNFELLLFMIENNPFLKSVFDNKSLRLNVFKGINYTNKFPNTLKMWKIQDNMIWIKNCPLPKNEEFKRLKNI
jgi:organic radical activating enzyme